MAIKTERFPGLDTNRQPRKMIINPNQHTDAQLMGFFKNALRRMGNKKPVKIEFTDITIPDIATNQDPHCDNFSLDGYWYKDHASLLAPEKIDDLKMAVETARIAKEIIIFQPRRKRVKVSENPHKDQFEGHSPRKFTPESERKTRKIGRTLKRTMRRNINEFLDFLDTNGI